MIFLLLGLLLNSVSVQGIEGIIMDKDHNPVAGAYVYAFRADEKEVLRSPDFISQVTKIDGKYTLYLPAGDYIIKSRKKISGERFGPLETYDLTSAGKIIIKVEEGKFTSKNITVYDLKTAAEAFSYEDRTDMGIVKGRITDKKGQPVGNSYAMAYAGSKSTGLPDYISGLTDKNGEFELYLPIGSRVRIAAAIDSLDKLNDIEEYVEIKVENKLVSGVEIIIK